MAFDVPLAGSSLPRIASAGDAAKGQAPARADERREPVVRRRTGR